VADESPRSRAARDAAERALTRVVHHYGSRPEFVLLGGLVPDLLCSTSAQRHAGTTDVDVQVDLEIAAGSGNTRRLEQALRNAEFVPDGRSTWRWTTTGFASRDVEVRELRARVGGVVQTAEINVTGLGGFLLAKCAAARARRKPKDWYDIAFVLLHNDAGGVDPAAAAIRERFGPELPSVRTNLDDLLANFADPSAQGCRAYIEQMLVDHPDMESSVLAADAVLAVERMHHLLTSDAS
jgi:hypothetical protein